MYDADVRVALRMALCFAAAAGLTAQVPDMPRGMYCGGNQLRFEGDLKGSAVAGAVVDPSGVAVPRARVQVQIRGRDEILKDFETNDSGRFRLRGLPPGHYWLGISRSGFNLHYWSLTIRRRSGQAAIRVELSVGT